MFDEFVNPLVKQANARRAKLESDDPEYNHRIDWALNSNRLNVALLGYGEEHGQTYDGLGISVSIVSLNLETWDMTSISLSRDIRVPELEEPVSEPPRLPWTLRYAYYERGFNGIRSILEKMTGLSIDFQILMKDISLQNYLQKVNGPVELVVPKNFQTSVYRLDGVEHGRNFIPAGRQVLSPDKAMTFVLGEQFEPRGKIDERSYRKNLLLRTLTCQAREKLASKDAGFVAKLLGFAISEFRSQNLITDFNFALITNGLSRVAYAFLYNRGNVDATFPQFNAARMLVVHDDSFGDGGVRRVHRIMEYPDDHGIRDDPLIKREIQLNAIPPYMLIPIGGNPYAEDLVSDYWFSVRELIKTTLMRST